MSSTIEENQDGYNQVTYEILDRIENLKKGTKNGMVVGEAQIIRGMDMFAQAVKAIDPPTLNEEAMYLISRCLDVSLFKEHERKGHISSHIHYGINTCYMALDLYDKSKKRQLIKQ